MAQEHPRMVYRGREVRFEQHDDLITARITGRRDFGVQRLDDGRYTTTLLPYDTFDSLEALVEAVLDQHPDYRQ